MKGTCLSFLICVASLWAQRTEPEVYSPLGKAYFARPDPTGVVAKADLALAQGGDKADLIFGAARARDQFLRFGDAIPIYTRGSQIYPDDVRFLRYRGHRLLSIRRFDAALVDLKSAATMVPASFDVAYHLALAYFLRGDYNHAAREYMRCLAMGDKPKPPFLHGLPADWRSCYALDDDARVALTDWTYRALRRAGKLAEARQLLDRITEKMNVKENTAYHRALLFYKGLRTEEQTTGGPAAGNSFATAAYGVTVFLRQEGQAERACKLLKRITTEENWSAFGLIGAETDLARGACGAKNK